MYSNSIANTEISKHHITSAFPIRHFVVYEIRRNKVKAHMYKFTADNEPSQCLLYLHNSINFMFIFTSIKPSTKYITNKQLHYENDNSLIINKRNSITE